MQLTLSLPDELAIAIKKIANSEKFICYKLRLNAIFVNLGE